MLGVKSRLLKAIDGGALGNPYEEDGLQILHDLIYDEDQDDRHQPCDKQELSVCPHQQIRS